MQKMRQGKAVCFSLDVAALADAGTAVITVATLVDGAYITGAMTSVGAEVGISATGYNVVMTKAGSKTTFTFTNNTGAAFTGTFKVLCVI